MEMKIWCCGMLGALVLLSCGGDSPSQLGTGKSSTDEPDTAQADSTGTDTLPSDSGSPDTPDTSATDTAPSTYEYDGGTSYEDVNQALLELDVQAFFDSLPAQASFTYIDAYVALIGSWGGDCSEPSSSGSWRRYSAGNTGCTTDDGVDLYGYLDFYLEDDIPYQMSGELAAVLPDGTEAYQDSDNVYSSASYYESSDLYTWSAVLTGAFQHSGTQYADHWLSRLHFADLSIYAMTYSSGARYYIFQGAGEATHGDIEAFYIPLVLAWKSGSVCPTELANDIWFRLSDGRWVQVVFDTTSDEYGDGIALTGDCDGCATALLDGESLGEVCLDLTTLLWEPGETPW